MVDKDAIFSNSPVRKVNFDNAGIDISVYPVPVSDGKLFVVSSGNITGNAVLFDATGKAIKSFKLNGSINPLDVSSISKGSYQLKILTTNSTQTVKIIIQ